MNLVDINFIPCSQGCAGNCPISRREQEMSSEICCEGSRACCFFCFEDTCPIKSEYVDEINAGLANIPGNEDNTGDCNLDADKIIERLGINAGAKKQNR